MNRRNFLKSALVTTIAFPTIATAINKPPPLKLERVRIVGNYIDIVSVEELVSYGIRSHYYSASCVDYKGRFFHENGYNDNHMEPFVRLTHVVRGMPRLWYYPERDVKRVIEYYRSGRMATNPDNGEKHSLENAINDIRENMEYVCFFAYCHFPGVPEEAWPEKWMPVVGGMSKYRYNNAVRMLNI